MREIQQILLTLDVKRTDPNSNLEHGFAVLAIVDNANDDGEIISPFNSNIAHSGGEDDKVLL